MSEIRNSGLDQYGTGPFEQQQFGTAGVEGVTIFVCGNLVVVRFGYRQSDWLERLGFYASQMIGWEDHLRNDL